MTPVPEAPSLAPIRLATLLTLAWPIVMARATQSVMGFFDALMTAPLGEDALAAAATGALNTFAIMILPLGTAFIVQSFASQLAGRGDLAAARRYAWYGLVLALFTAVLGLVATPFLPRALQIFEYEPNVRALMTEYLQLRLLSLGAIVGTEVLGSWYGGIGNTRYQMIAGVVAMVSDLFFNWVLIYGNLGAPAMGVAGSALSSTIGSWLGFAVIAFAMWRGWGGAGRAPAQLELKAKELWRMIRFGFPNGLNWFLEFSAFALFFNVVMAHLGTIPLAALNVAMEINSVSFMPAFGMASAGAILVGQAVGRGARHEVWPIVRMTALVTLGWMAPIGAIYFLFPDFLVGWFAPPGKNAAEMLAIGATMLAISSAWQLFDAVAMTLSESLRACGDTTWCLWARIGLAWFVFTPAAFVAVFVLKGGIVAAMICLVGYVALLALVLAWRFRSGAWRKIDLIGEGIAPLV